MANLQKLRNEFRMLSRQSNDQGFKSHCAIVRATLARLEQATTPAEREELEARVRTNLKELKDYLALTSRHSDGEGNG